MSSARQLPTHEIEICKALLREAQEDQSPLIRENDRQKLYRKLMKGWKISNDHPEDHVLLFLMSKHIDFTIENIRHKIDREDIVYIQPGSKFTIHPPSGAETPTSLAQGPKFYYFQFRFSSPHPKKYSKPSFFILRNAGRLRLYFEDLYEEFRRERGDNDVLIRGLLNYIIGRCLRSFQEQGPVIRQFTLPQKAHLDNYLRINTGKHIAVRELSKHLNLSQRYFNQIFRNTFNMSARQWIVSERMNSAILKLHMTDLKITEIARLMGYKDIFLFSKHFKKITGRSPMAFRKSR